MSAGKTIQITFDTKEECEQIRQYAHIKKKCTASVFIKQLIYSEMQRHPLKRHTDDLKAYIDKTIAEHIKRYLSTGGALP